MGRSKRIEYRGSWHHVYNFGASGKKLFPTEQNRTMFLGLVNEITELFGIEVHCWYLAENSYHLLIRNPNGNLSAAMRHLGGVYTRRCHCIGFSQGPLFKSRYKAFLLDADRYLLQVSRFIHWLPVDSGLVERPDLYIWSSYREYIGLCKRPPWLFTKAVLSAFGAEDQETLYSSFVSKGCDGEIRSFYNDRPNPPVIGSPIFRDNLNRVLAECGVDYSENKKLKASSWDISEIIELTAHRMNVQVAAMFNVRNGRGHSNPPRAIAMTLCRDPGGHCNRDIAREFKIGNSRSVSVIVGRLKQKLGGNDELKRIVTELRDEMLARKESLN